MDHHFCFSFLVVLCFIPWRIQFLYCLLWPSLVCCFIKINIKPNSSIPEHPCFSMLIESLQSHGLLVISIEKLYFIFFSGDYGKSYWSTAIWSRPIFPRFAWLVISPRTIDCGFWEAQLWGLWGQNSRGEIVQEKGRDWRGRGCC